MGGVFFTPQGSDYQSTLWRQAFPAWVSQQLVSWANLQGKVSNSDLELLATIAHHDAIVSQVDVRERTIHTLTDNTPTQAWQTKGSATTTGPAAYLLRAQALHQRHHRYLARVSYIKGESNQLADECSRQWQLTDKELLTHFNSSYPQATSWQLCHLQPNTVSSLISSLRKERPAPESWLLTPKPKTIPGSFGNSFVQNCPKAQNYTTFRNPLHSCKSLPGESEMAAYLPADSPCKLLQWQEPYWQLARSSPHWGPRTLA